MVSIIVLNYNGEETLQKCLDTVVSQDYPNSEVIVVDNASSDDSPAIMRRYSPRIRLLVNSRNVGYAAGMNLGEEAASDKSQFLAFVTQDVLLSQWWVRMAVKLASSEKNVAAVSSNIYDESKQSRISELRILYPSGYYYIPLNSESKPVEIDFPSGEAFLIHRSYFRILGKFDSDYFAYYDDGDLGWRTRLAGLRILYGHDLQVTHRRSSVFGKEPLEYRVYLHERNRIISCLKNLSPQSLLAFAVSEVLMLLFHFSRASSEKESAKLRSAYVHALSYAILHLPVTLNKRKLTQKMRKRTDRSLFCNSLPRNVMRKPGLVLAYSPEYRRKERYYLLILDVIAKILPPR